MKNLKIILIAVLLCGLFIGAVSAAPQLYLDSYNASLNLNMHMNGTEGGTVFIDDTGKATITVHGNTNTNTTTKYLGNASAYFDGNGDYLSIANSTYYDFGTGNFTISFWVNLSSTVNDQGIFTLQGGTTNYDVLSIRTAPSDTIWFRSSGTNFGTYSVSANTWYHIAIIRSGNTLYSYVNGVSLGSKNVTGLSYSNAGDSWIGQYYDSGYSINGYIDEFAIWKGVAIPVSELHPQPYEVETTIPPVATFTATPTEGSTPLSVQFTETSTSSGTSWQWNATNVIGDNIPFTFNTTSGEPIYIFSSAGNYSINLKSTNVGGSNISTQITFVNVSQGRQITSNFTISNSSGIEPLLTHFTDTSTTNEAMIDAWLWDFGDGITSTVQNPDHTYVSAGTYVANLTITNISHSLISTKLMDITVISSVVVANFSANATTGYPNDYFQFSDLTSDTPLTWAWDFGDGNTSTDQNPVHQYTAVGLYDVALDVTNSTSFNSTTKLNYINISALPAPTVPTFTANKTYTTNPTLPSSFTVTSAVPPRMVSYNLSFGDGTWSNTTSSSFSAIEHTYSSVGVYSPTLYVYNAAGEAHTTSTDMIIISNPHVYLIDNPTIINYGIPSNLTLQLDNVSHVDVVTVNVTYNKTALEVKNVYATTGWSQQNTIGSGFVKINLTKADTSSDVNISAAYIQFNVTQSIGLNASEPINFVAASSGVVPNTSYTSGLYAFNKTYDGSITPTTTAVTQTFNIYRTDTGELLSTVQVTNDYTGIINGTAYTTSGTFTITSSLWGTVNLTSSASAFYANTLYGVEINGGTTNIYMTPYVPDNTVKLNQLYPKEVRFVALDTANGAVIPGIGVTAVSYNATYDGTNWEAKLYGVSSAATSIQDTVMVGTTDAGGSITFPMISSNQYAMSFVNASAGINQSLLVFPLQTEYRVWIDTTGATNNTLSQISGSNLTVSEPNSSYVTLGMNYIDTSGLTENVTFTVTSQSNSTVIYTETITSGITAGVSSDYTIQNIRGDGFVWKYVAYRSDSSVLSQGAGVTMKGPNGVLVDMGLPSTGWYQWISMCCLFMLASLASQRTKQYWALLIPIFAAIFLWFGWFTGKSTLAGIVILCAVLGAIIYMKSSLREKFGIGGPGTMLLNIIVYLMILQACVGFINGLEIWSDAGMTNQAVTPTNAYMNIELTTISNLQGAAGLTGDIIATATIFVDMALTALGIFGFMLFSLITIYPTIQLLFPWMLQSAQTIALFALIQIGIWIMYVLFIYQTWYKPTIGTADF